MNDGQSKSHAVDPLARYSISPSELKGLLATERSGMPFLAYRDETGGLATFVLPDDDRAIIVGRRDGVDLRLAWDEEVSGIHAELRRMGGEWTIADDGLSTNGTFLNAERVTARRRLRDGDRVRVGQTVLAFNAADRTPVRKTSIGHQDYPDRDQLSDSQRRILVALCRPMLSGSDLHAPATNEQIATEVFLGKDAVKMQLRALFGKYRLDQLPQNQKRAGLAQLALQLGLVTRGDL